MSGKTSRRAAGSFWWVVAAAPLVGLTWWGIARVTAVRRARVEGTAESLDRIRRPAVREVGSPRRRGAEEV